ncbi:TonB-dependent receptor [Flexithrix dorotheae]|uniref:TonB-dependent receptor n=1 Tax=Flexithrix dorotheae TaxID=70993 RepID=UPI00036CE2ED|nr:TonB-dependent receptor [Flexithrix dorotheae]
MKQFSFLFFFISFLILQNTFSQDFSTSDSTKINSLIILPELPIATAYFAESNSPFTIHNLKKKELQPLNFGQEPSFILQNTPSVTAYSDAGSYYGYSYIRMRGIDQTRINMTLDGVPLNEPEDQGVYFSNFPDFLNSLDGMQLIRGIGNSKNGSASYGGSIQFDSPVLNDSLSAEVGIDYGSYNTYRIYGEFNSGVKQNKGIYLRASQLHSDGYKYRSGNIGQSLFYSAGYFGESVTWKLTGFAGNQKNEMAWIGVPKAEIEDDPRTNGNANENDQFFQTLIQLQNQIKISEKSAFHSSLYYNYLEGNYDFDSNNFVGLPSNDEMFNYAFQSNFLGMFANYQFNSRHLGLVAGFHGNLYNRNHKGSELNLGQLYSNTGFKNEISGFLKLNYESEKWLGLVDLQVRNTSFSYKGNVEMDALTWNFFNPKAGLSYLLNDKTTFYYSVGYTGREPTRNDIFQGWDDLQADSLGNPDLGNTSPEYVTDHEFGMRISNHKYYLNLNGYYMDFKNEIVLNGQFGPNGIALTNNVEKSFRTGVELDFNWRINEHLGYKNSASFNYSRITESEITFSPILTPKFILFQEVVFHWKNLSAALNGRFQDYSYIDFANDNKIDSYFLVNSRLAYQIQKFTFMVRVNNLFNIKYFNNGYVDYDGVSKYFIQAPRNYMLSVKWRL